MNATREQTPAGGAGAARPTWDATTEIADLPLGKIMRIAWRGIRIRIWRSLLVVSGIILAIAFLSYILSSSSFMGNVTKLGSAALLETLAGEGLLAAGDADRLIETYWMAGLALLISFVGIVNAMLMSVTERFREIGTMKCLGALDGFVLRLFLLESLFEGAVGTVLGLTLGLLLSYAEGLVTFGPEVWRLLPLAQLAKLVGGCLLAGVTLTVLGALYPAYRAAKMPPVAALRSEI